MKEYLSDIYQTAYRNEADRVFDFRNGETHNARHPVVLYETHSNKPLVWVVPDLLTRQECDSILKQLENNNLVGKDAPQTVKVRNWEGETESLSQALFPRLEHEYQHHKSLYADDDDEKAYDVVHSICDKWRILKLEAEEEFPAHHDAMDSFHDHQKDAHAISTHSVLMEFRNESREAQLVDGGATRFYYRQYPFDGPYDYCVDVYLPVGWALIMQQRADLWYALQPQRDVENLQSESMVNRRYAIQTGFLKILPTGETVESLRHGGGAKVPTTFGLGPGLMDLFEEECQSVCPGENPVPGWGKGSFNPKATMWKQGTPIFASSESMPKQKQQMRRSSLPNLGRQHLPSGSADPEKFHESFRERHHHRSSLQAEVDPIRKRISYAPKQPRRPKKTPAVHPNDSLEDSITSITADFSESNFSLGKGMGDANFVFRGIPNHLEGGRRRLSIQVTRQPKRDSLVGKLMTVFQDSPEDRMPPPPEALIVSDASTGVGSD